MHSDALMRSLTLRVGYVRGQGRCVDALQVHVRRVTLGTNGICRRPIGVLFPQDRYPLPQPRDRPASFYAPKEILHVD
jgi:hypothetical protein